MSLRAERSNPALTHRVCFVALLLAMTAWSLSYADAYSTLLQRYEVQIKQQERQLRSLRKNLLQKEQEAKRWEQKAEAA